MPEIFKIPLDLLDDPKLAIRTELDDESLQELMASMREFGLLQAIVVRKVADRFEIIAGHRRARAARLLDWTHIDASVIEADEDMVLVLRLTENLQRQDLDPVDEACFIGEAMLKYKKTAEQIAQVLRRSAQWVNERIEVFEMPDYMQQHLKQKKYSLGAALWIARIENEDTRRYYAMWAAVNGCTVAYAHRWYVTLKETDFIRNTLTDVVVGADTPQQTIRKVLTCARCGQDLFLDEADSVLIHRVCPDTEQKPKL